MTASSAAGSPAVASQSPGDDNLVEPPVKRRRETNGSGSAVVSVTRRPGRSPNHPVCRVALEASQIGLSM